MIITKQDIPNFLDSLKNNYQVFAPVKQDNYTMFKAITSGSDATLDYSNSKIPPKGILFPQTEELFSYKVDKQGAHLEEKIDSGQKVIFGIRPCDAKSIALLDNVFNNDKYEDPYYLTRRENTVLVGIGCSQPQNTCFCTSVEGGPFDTTNLDLLLVDIGDKYVVEVLTDKGKKVLTSAAASDASEADKQAAAKTKEGAAVVSNVNIDGLKQKLDSNFYDEIWDSISEKCIGCAACTYSCPTCHCFDIVDEAKDCDGCRVRNWDSCMFPQFTIHGSGHNPRPSGKERFRNRVMHKFKYFIDVNNATACVGCGRCIQNCPVNLDIREVLADIQGSEARSVS